MERRSRFAIVYRLLPLLLLFQLLGAPFGSAAPALQTEEPAPLPMEFEPPADADSLEDFLPPSIELQRIATDRDVPIAAGLPAGHGGAFSFSDDKVAVVVEGQTFEGDVTLHDCRAPR